MRGGVGCEIIHNGYITGDHAGKEKDRKCDEGIEKISHGGWG